jgi:hypothetical protein
MRINTFLLLASIIAAPAFAQQVPRSSSPQGIQILGNTEIQAQQQNSGAV